MKNAIKILLLTAIAATCSPATSTATQESAYYMGPFQYEDFNKTTNSTTFMSIEDYLNQFKNKTNEIQLSAELALSAWEKLSQANSQMNEIKSKLQIERGELENLREKEINLLDQISRSTGLAGWAKRNTEIPTKKLLVKVYDFNIAQLNSTSTEVGQSLDTFREGLMKTELFIRQIVGQYTEALRFTELYRILDSMKTLPIEIQAPPIPPHISD